MSNLWSGAGGPLGHGQEAQCPVLGLASHQLLAISGDCADWTPAGQGTYPRPCQQLLHMQRAFTACVLHVFNLCSDSFITLGELFRNANPRHDYRNADILVNGQCSLITSILTEHSIYA